MKRKHYEKEILRLQMELCRMQNWVKRTKAKVVVIFEGRDAAGKGGIIKRITQRVSSRIFRVVALPKPTDRERTQLYLQRYITQLPAGGEVALFDRSWYNRAGVEPVMGFCTEDQTRRFLDQVPDFEEWLVSGGMILLKYWLEVSSEEQEKRFQSRMSDPTKHWKLSPMDVEARARWFAYSRARDRMLDASDTEHAPWNIVKTDDKRCARLNCISHLLSSVPYDEPDWEPIDLPERDMSDAYDDKAAMKGRHYVPEIF